MRVAFIGWRGMVGSVLTERMEAEGDFDGLDVEFFSTSQAGALAPRGDGEIEDAGDLDALARADVVLTCQGGSYTEATYEPLRARGWDGTWIDAASTLRMADDAVIVLDPVNGDQIEEAIRAGTRTFVGGNCTVSLMLMAVAPLFRAGWVEWVSSMTYQAVSGAGAAAMEELLAQTEVVAALTPADGASALERERTVADLLRRGEGAFAGAALGAPIYANVLPWIDRAVEGGRTREEWKGHVEARKILGLEREVPVDGTCVRVPVLRCHAQALTLKLNRAVDLGEVEQALRAGHEWLRWVDNEREATLDGLTPAAAGGTLDVAVGRARRLRMGDDFLGLFTVGDQLLWGAAEPLRRVLGMIRRAG